MPLATQVNGSARPNGYPASLDKVQDELLQLNLDLKNLKYDDKYAKDHGDKLIGDTVAPTGFFARLDNSFEDIRRVFTLQNAPAIGAVAKKLLTTGQLDIKAGASLVGALPNDSNRRKALLDSQVKAKYDRMLHPPLTYLGDAFQYRQPDGKFNNVMNPHLGQAGAPYAKTVPSITHPLGALPDPGDIFDRLMARQDGGRNSKSGLSAMLIYHATIIIHDIFRTNDKDKNISDSSSYLDLSPLYGYTMEMQRAIRDDKYKLGLLKPDTFAEDRLLRQPPGVCIFLIMYNRYHNYAASQLRRINENGRFSVPDKYQGTKLEALARYCTNQSTEPRFVKACQEYNKAWKEHLAKEPPYDADRIQLDNKVRKIKQDNPLNRTEQIRQITEAKAEAAARDAQAIEEFKSSIEAQNLGRCAQVLEKYVTLKEDKRKEFETGYDAAWNKLDDDLFNTARLITSGLYIQVAVHDYLRALMGFHQFNTDFTLDPRLDIDHKNVSRGIGNQVTVEFNLLYRFHCAISQRDEDYTKKFMTETLGFADPDKVSLDEFIKTMAMGAKLAEDAKKRGEAPKPWETTFGLPLDPTCDFLRNPITGLFDDQQLIDALTASMDDPISNFGPRNVPKCLKPVEILGIKQSRAWQTGTLNDFRTFFQMPRHQTFESVTSNVDIQNALRDLYEHPDKIELYPGIFCESDANMGLDPGPSDVDSALWAAIFSDAITLVRSDIFYTVNWNTNSLTSWGMKEVTEDSSICKSSVFHRLLQRAFPGWFGYDSLRFFHPFYTSGQNAIFAEQQGYSQDFRFKRTGVDKDSGKPIFDVSKSMPQKPWKPVHLTEVEQITAILKDDTGDFVHPALRDYGNFPYEMQELFNAKNAFHKKPQKASPIEPIKEDTESIVKYYNDLMHYIVKRESITMSNTTFQLDVVRDFAIPVTTRSVADFLGFGHLIRDERNTKAPYSENEIYQHITNCQVFLSYNADETKLMKRRQAFRKSMQVLYKLTYDGNIYEAGKWGIFQRARDNPMTELGFEIAQRVLRHEKTTVRAAAVLVFVGLHTAYNSVLAFSSVLNTLMKELYDHANSDNPSGKTPTWTGVQKLAMSEDTKSFDMLRTVVLQTERTSIKLPMIRTSLKDRDLGGFKVKKGDTIILDIYRANLKVMEAATISGRSLKDEDFLNPKSSVTERIADYDPKNLAVLSVTLMIKTIAQMRNARRGHDAQGHLKKINLDSSAEGYSNFMAPQRMTRIARQVEMIKDSDLGNGKTKDDIYTDNILRPATDTYLTAEWDEFLPFPGTWKIRFDGFGESDYGKLYEALRQPKISVDALAAPPFYQPQGVSHVGGSFADVACICNVSGKECHCKPTSQASDQNAAEAGTSGTKKQVTQAEREISITTGCGIAN